MITILTNNPAVAGKYPDITRFIETDVAGIFVAVRDAVHTGARLVSHPLSGSIKPNESPYKSVIIDTEHAGLDYKSLQIIEDATSVLSRLPDRGRNHVESVLDDFRIIDLDLVDSGMQI